MDAQSPDPGTVDARLTSLARNGARLGARVWKVVRIAAKIGSYISEVLGLGGISIGILLQLWDLVCRNLGFARLDPLWLPDASTLALVGGAFIYVAATDRHLGFGGLLGLLGDARLERRASWATRPLVTACMVVLVVAGIQLVRQQMEAGGSYSSTFWSPLWLFYALFPLTFLLTGLRWITHGSLPEEGQFLDEAPPGGKETAAAALRKEVADGSSDTPLP